MRMVCMTAAAATIDWNSFFMVYLIPCLVIFLAKVTEAILTSLKITMLVRNDRMKATAICFFEVLIWALIVSNVITDLHASLHKLLAYCLGYTAGYYLGATINQRLALGSVIMNAVVPIESMGAAVKILDRDRIPYTYVHSHGHDTESIIFYLVVEQKQQELVTRDIKAACPKAFFFISDAKRLIGGIQHIGK